MEELFGYQRYLQEEKGSSANTVNSYCRDVRQYLCWLDSEKLAPEAAEQTDVAHYTKYLLSL